MRNRSRLPVVAIALALAVAGAPATAQLGQFVQAQVDAQIQDMQECRARVLYTVPAGKRLRIDWMSVVAAEFQGDDFDPVDVTVRTKVGGPAIVHHLARVGDAEAVGVGLVKTAKWSSQVTFYASAGTTVIVRACRNNDTDATSVFVTMHGQLFDE